MISNSNKMQPPLNAWKGWHSISAGFLKKQEPSKKHPIKKLKSSNRGWRAKNQEGKTKKVKQLHWEISKFKT